MLDLPRERGPGRDDLDAAAEHPLEHRADQRVVRAAEDHRVDPRLAQRRDVAADGVLHPLVEREPALDDRREVRARDGDRGPRAGRPRRSPRRRRRCRPSPASRAARCARCASPPPPAPPRAARRRARRRPASSPSSAAAAPAAPRPSPCCTRRRAASPGGASSSSAISQRRSARAPAARALAVREARGVAEVDEVLVRAACTSSSCSTVRPPTPESKTPIGRARDRAQARWRAARPGNARRTRPRPRRPPALLACRRLSSAPTLSIWFWIWVRDLRGDRGRRSVPARRPRRQRSRPRRAGSRATYSTVPWPRSAAERTERVPADHHGHLSSLDPIDGRAESTEGSRDRTRRSL